MSFENHSVNSSWESNSVGIMKCSSAHSYNNCTQYHQSNRLGIGWRQKSSYCGLTHHTEDTSVLLCQTYGTVTSVGSIQRLRSATCGDLVVSSSTTHFSARAFAVVGPKVWNQLPAHLWALEAVGPFKTALKTYLHSTQWLSQIVWLAAPL